MSKLSQKKTPILFLVAAVRIASDVSFAFRQPYYNLQTCGHVASPKITLCILRRLGTYDNAITWRSSPDSNTGRTTRGGPVACRNSFLGWNSDLVCSLQIIRIACCFCNLGPRWEGRAVRGNQCNIWQSLLGQEPREALVI